MLLFDQTAPRFTWWSHMEVSASFTGYYTVITDNCHGPSHEAYAASVSSIHARINLTILLIYNIVNGHFDVPLDCGQLMV